MTDAELQTLENLGHGDAAEEIRDLRAELAASREREARMRDAIDAAANIIGDAPWWCDIWAAHDKGAQG